MADTFPEPTSLEPINVLQFDSAGEAADAVRAASILDLGVTLANQLVPDQDDEDDSYIEQWVVTVFASAPATG